MNETTTAPTDAIEPKTPVTPDAAPPDVTPDAPEPSQAEVDAAFKALDERWDKRNKPEAPKAPDAGATKPAEASEDADKDKDAKEPEKPASEAADAKEGKKITPKWYREQIDKTNAELKSLKDSLSAAENKLKEAETKGKDTTVLAEKVAALEKDLNDARASLRAAKQELSPEFKERYEKPFNDAADVAKVEVEQLMVYDADGQPVRQASWEKDFASLYNLDYIPAKQRAKELFGEDAPVAMEHYLALKRLERNRNSALREEQTKWQERTKAEEIKKAKQREAFESIRGKIDADVVAKYQWTQEDPKDPEGNALLKEGYATVDTKPRNITEAALLRSVTRHWAAAAPRLAATNDKLRAEVESLKKTIEEMKGAGPGPAKRGGTTEAPKPKSWNDELREEMG